VRARARLRRRWRELQLAPDGLPRPDAPLGQGPLAARLLALAIDAAVVVGSRLPAPVAHALAVAGGTAEWAVRPGKRRRLAGNLARAVSRPPGDPIVKELVRREIANEARRSADLLWALGRPDEFLSSVQLDGLEHVRAAAAPGRGVLLAGIHVGGWEVATVLPGAVVPVRTTAIVADDWLAWAIEHTRTSVGLSVLYRTEPALRAARLLRRGEALLVLGDDGGEHPRGYAVRFVGGAAELPAGIVSLARLCCSPIVSFYVLPLGPRRWRVTIDPPVAPPGRREGAEGERRVLQQLADRWSEVIRRNPEHWAAVYPIHWLDEPAAGGAR
jgi:KDO2-lipid IV(A) lauroyltransferase